MFRCGARGGLEPPPPLRVLAPSEARALPIQLLAHVWSTGVRQLQARLSTGVAATAFDADAGDRTPDPTRPEAATLAADSTVSTAFESAFYLALTAPRE